MTIDKLEGGTNEGVFYAGDAKAIDVVGVDPTARQSSLCCGFCCDVRRASIIVDIIYCCFASIGLLSSLLGYGMISSIDFDELEGYDDDQLQANMEQSSAIFLIAIIMSVANVIFCGIGIYGAMKYNECMVVLTGVWYCVVTIFDAIAMNWSGAVLAAFFAYPHIALFHEMKRGVITPENYINEKHSCCCV